MSASVLRSIRSSHSPNPARLGIALAVVAWIGCATADSEKNTFGSGGEGGSAGVGTGGSGATPGTGGFIDASIGDAPNDAACVYIMEEGNRIPLSLYVMFDKSSSMLGTKWDSAKLGLNAFLTDPMSAGIRVALNFFPRTPDATPACDHPAYKEPRVPFAELPPNATAIEQAMDAESPNGFGTPIFPALGGALLKCMEIVQPGEKAAVLLVTDGEPQGPAPLCAGVDPEEPQVIADLAATGMAQSPPIPTYVIGLPGANQTTAQQIATAGGGTAILVGSTNVEAEFQGALAAVRGDALPCEFEIPESVERGDVDPGNVNVAYTAGGTTEPEIIPQTDCSGAGWQYDNPSEPRRIILCPATCDRIKADLEARVEIMLGCKTQVL